MLAERDCVICKKNQFKTAIFPIFLFLSYYLKHQYLFYTFIIMLVIKWKIKNFKML